MDARDRINALNLDTSHFNPANRDHPPSVPLEQLLICGSKIKSSKLKPKLFKAKLISEICNICKPEPMWQEKKLVLVLDHINGDRHDNRIGNLRLLCPNCNSQTDTFAGRNKKRKYNEA